MDTTALISAIGGAILGSGGAAAFFGVWLKYKVDSATLRANTEAQRANSEAKRAEEAARTYEALSNDQQRFRESLMTEVAAMRAELKTTNAENDALIRTNADLSARVTTQESKIEALTQRLTATLLERDLFLRQVETQHKEIEMLRAEIEKLKSAQLKSSAQIRRTT